MINETKSKFLVCSDDEAQDLAKDRMKRLLSDSTIVNLIKNNQISILATVRSAKYIEYLNNPNKTFYVDIITIPNNHSSNQENDYFY